jgi:hypothetical protein
MIKTQYLKPSRLFSVLLLFFVSTIVFATPNGKDLLAACEHSLTKGFSGTEGMMCTWYVTPCDCFHSEDSGILRVCLPQTPDVDALAREVMKELAATPELLEMSADVAARLILGKSFPCVNE